MHEEKNRNRMKIHFMNTKHLNGFCNLLKVKEKREKRKRKRDICLYLILSAGTIAGTLNF